jgi:hypothetical protein
MLSKIRDCFRLSGQLWIKDQPDRSRVRVLELECAVLNRLIGLPIGLYVSGRLSNCLACPSQLVGVLHRLHPPNSAEPSRVTQQRVTFCANLSRLSEAGRHVNPKGTMFYTSHEKLVDSRPKQATVGPASFAIQTAQTIKTSQRPNKWARSTGLLQKFNCSSLGLDSGDAPSFQAIPPRSNAWTALRESLSRQLPPSKPPNQAARCSRATQSLPRREASASLLPI